MHLLLCISIVIAVISGAASRNPLNSPRYQGAFFSRPINNAISPFHSSRRQGFCRYGSRRDCCYGWKRNEFGTCSPICEKPCVHGSCSGPNTCKCEPGYTGPTCAQDYNECSVQPCDHRCMNTPGSYRCYCDHGYLLLQDGRTCTRDDRCRSTRCAFGCVQYEDGFNCFCPDGMRITMDGLGCEDIDECAEGTANCPRGRRCSNTYGNYLCLCPEGYKFQYVSGKLSCVDDNECTANRDKCDANAYCENLSGGYRCVCNAGYVGTGQKCLPLGKDTCLDRPCFEGVECTNIRIDVNTLDYEGGLPAKRYTCGSCPSGYTGDGITCVTSNVDVTILVLEQVDKTPIPDVKVSTFDITSGGDTEFSQAFTLMNGVVKLPVPNDASIIVVASKAGYPPASQTFDVNPNEPNLITLMLGNYNDGVDFRHPLPNTRTFSFGDPNSPGGRLQVEIPEGSLNATRGATINLNVRTIDFSDPGSVQSMPYLASSSEGGETARLETFAVAEIGVTDSATNKPVSLTEAATLRIPVSDRAESVSVGDVIPAWYFDEAIGLWVQDGLGVIEDDGQGGLVWVYQAEHFTWWAAARSWIGMQLVNIRTCFTEDCSLVAPHTPVQIFGRDYLYQATLTTTSKGAQRTFLKSGGAIQVFHSCSEEAVDYNITPETSEITFKVPDTVNLGCPDPGPVEDGTRLGDDFEYGGQVTFYCNPGFEIHGSSRRVCQACGSWSGYQPYCTELPSSSSSTSSSSSSSSESAPAGITTAIFSSPEEGSGDIPQEI